MTYSLKEVVTDGQLTAPRYVQHFVKIGIHSMATIAVWLVFRHATTSALIGGPLLWALIATREIIWPTDLQPLTQWQHAADCLTDWSLSNVPLVIMLLATGHWGSAVILAAICSVTYVYCHKDARP